MKQKHSLQWNNEVTILMQSQLRFFSFSVLHEWWVAGVVICLERGADLHMAQLMPLPLTISCFSKIQIGFTFLVPAHTGSPGKGPLDGCVCVCVCVCVCMRACMRACVSVLHEWRLCVWHCWKELKHLNLNVPVVISKCMQAVKLCYNKIIQILTDMPASTGRPV